MNTIFSTTNVIIMLCCYTLTVLICYLQHYLYEKTSKKTGKNYKVTMFKIDNTKTPIKSKEYWIASLDEVFIVIITLFLLSYIKHSLNIEFSISENIAWGLLICIPLFVISKAIAYCLYKLHVVKRKENIIIEKS